jgi:hypothetical protein
MAAALVLAGCGGESADLFEVQRSGPGAVEVVVNDGGTARCDRAKARQLPSDRLLDAREIARGLEKQARLSIDLPKGPRATRHYTVRTPVGRTAFWDTSPGAPKVFSRLQVLTRQLAEEVC